GNIAASNGTRPAVLSEAAPEALRPAHGRIRLGGASLERRNLVERGESRGAAIVGYLDECPISGVDLQAHGRAAEGLVVEPSVETHLQHDLRVFVAGDPPADLGIADQMRASTVGEDEVGYADDLTDRPRQVRRDDEQPLVDGRLCGRKH